MAIPVWRPFLHHILAGHSLSFRTWLSSQTWLCVRIHRFMWKIQIPRPYPRYTEIASPGMGKGIIFLIAPQVSRILIHAWEPDWPSTSFSCLLLMSYCSVVGQTALYSSGSENGLPGPAISIPLGAFRNAHCQVHPRPVLSNTLGIGPSRRS